MYSPFAAKEAVVDDADADADSEADADAETNTALNNTAHKRPPLFRIRNPDF